MDHDEYLQQTVVTVNLVIFFRQDEDDQQFGRQCSDLMLKIITKI